MKTEKIEAVIKKMCEAEPDQFYLMHRALEWESEPKYTFFGIGSIALHLPGVFGEEVKVDTAERILKYLQDKFGKEPIERMEQVLLPKKSEIKVGKSKVKPTTVELVGSDAGTLYPVPHRFRVAGWLLKLALEANPDFRGWRVPDSPYNPLHLTDEEEDMWGVILPYIVKDNGEMAE